MVDKITINIDSPVTEQQAKNIATYLAVHLTDVQYFCFAWVDGDGKEYNPDKRHTSEAELVLAMIAPNNRWEFYFVDSFKQFKKGSECAT